MIEDNAAAFKVCLLVMATTWFAMTFLKPYPNPSNNTGGPKRALILAPERSTVLGYAPITAVLIVDASNMLTSKLSIIA